MVANDFSHPEAFDDVSQPQQVCVDSCFQVASEREAHVMRSPLRCRVAEQQGPELGFAGVFAAVIFVKSTESAPSSPTLSRQSFEVIDKPCLLIARFHFGWSPKPHEP